MEFLRQVSRIVIATAAAMLIALIAVQDLGVPADTVRSTALAAAGLIAAALMIRVRR
jgi:hypothetical protein